MLDPKVVTQMVEEQIARSVNDQVLEVFTNEELLRPIEEKIVRYTQDRILGKFANSGAVPEIVDAVKRSVTQLFDRGQIPGIDQFVDPVKIKQAVDHAVETNVMTAVENMMKDPVWIKRVETLVNQAMIQRVVAGLSTIDITGLIHQRVDETMSSWQKQIVETTKTSGIQDLAKQCELTVMDQQVVVENVLTAKHIEAVGSATVRDLSVTGSINTDNRSWQTLSKHISDQTLEKLTDQWRESLVTDVENKIRERGINFSQVVVDGERVVNGSALSKKITQTNIQKLGTLTDLTVSGNTYLNSTVSVLNKRVGINTQEPEMALSVWDEEVNVLAGKLKEKTAYIGTGRAQGLSLGVNRTPAVEIDIDGLTTVKKLRLGIHKIGYGSEVPNYSGTRGEIVFNSAPTVNDNVFAWQCLGGFKWKLIRAIE